MSDPVNMVDKDGNTYAVPADKVAGAIDQGFTVEAKDAGLKRAGDTALKDYYTSSAGKVAAAGFGLARGASLGLSDVALNALTGGEAGEALNKIQAYNPGVSTVANIVGGLGTGGLGVGKGIAGEGASLARSFVGHAAEGSVIGLGQGVSELALSDQPLTAEHIASTLTSNLMLGGAIGGIAGGGFSAVERTLARAGGTLAESAAARTALESLPEDLTKLDDEGLKGAATTAKAEHAADVAAERKSLEQLRVEKRVDLSNDVRDLHNDLSTERPIFQAVQGDDVAKIPGISDIKVRLAKSFDGLRSQLDNEIAVARDPRSLIRPLELRQGALEALQEKVPELHAALAGDARADALIHVGDALEQTKAQIAAIDHLSPKTPLASGRLTMLESGPSPRMQAIDAAREALKKGPEVGLLQKGAQAGAFAGGTALAHMIPGVGIAAPFLGKGASDIVGKLFEHMAGANKAIVAKTSEAAKSFLSAAKTISPYVAPTATKVLGAVKFAATNTEPKSSSLPDLYTARSNELKTQTMYAPDGSVQMRPEARAALAKKLDPIRSVNPKLADQIETIHARKVALMSQKLPRRPDVNGLQIGPDTCRPSDMAMRSWARTVRACEDPHGVEQRLAQGIMTPEEAEAYRTVYPERFAALQQTIFSAAPMLAKTLPMNKKVALSTFTGVPLIPALQPNVLKLLQSNFVVEPGTSGGQQSPTAQPNYGSMGSLKDMDKPTPAQERQS